jgi:hypothetical protein
MELKKTTKTSVKIVGILSEPDPSLLASTCPVMFNTVAITSIMNRPRPYN